MFFIHIDTLYFSAIPKKPKLFKTILTEISEAKDNGLKFSDGRRILAGYKNWQYGFVCECGAWVNIAEGKKLGDAFPIYVRVPAEILLQYHKCLDKLIIDIGKQFGGFVVCKISRLDIAVDTDECKVKTNWTRKLQCRAFSGSAVSMDRPPDDPSDSSSNKLTIYYQDNPFLKHEGFTGITFGSGLSASVYFRIYEKLFEIKRRHGNLDGYLEVVSEYGYKKEGEKIIWRFEFELKREFLSNFGFDTVQETLTGLDRLYHFLTTDWVSMNGQARLYSRFWDKMQKLKFNSKGGEVLERISKVNIQQMQAQVIGVFARIFEEKRLEPEDMLSYVLTLLSDPIYEEKLFEWKAKKKIVAEDQKLKTVLDAVDNSFKKSQLADFEKYQQKKEALLEASKNVC